MKKYEVIRVGDDWVTLIITQFVLNDEPHWTEVSPSMPSEHNWWKCLIKYWFNSVVRVRNFSWGES